MNAVARDLGSGSRILWYQIESVLGRGGFGITYLARDTNLGQLVAIKEYLPFEYAARNGDSTVQPLSAERGDAFSLGLERFMSEAQVLAKFKHPNIVRVLSVFKHNNTGYIVMEYERGEDLSDVYKRKKKLTQRELEDIFYPIIDGLASVHKKGFIHRDIKPSNIYIRRDGSPVLIDFGSARQASGSVTKTLTSIFSAGYAPFEQYYQSAGKQGPWTDVYALSASIYQGITGEKPQDSTIRGVAVLHHESDPYKPLSKLGIESYTYAFLKTIDQALMIPTDDRPQTLDDFLGMLKGDIRLLGLPAIPTADYQPTVIGKRTITGLNDQKYAVDEVTITDQHTKTEAIANTCKDQTHMAKAHAVAPVEQTLRLNRFKRERFKSPQFLLIVAGILVIIVVGAMLPLAEKSPEEVRQQQLDGLLGKADKLISLGKYYDGNGTGALDIYQQILAMEPENLAAKNGIKIVALDYLLKAQQYINNGNFGQAGASIKIVKAIDPGFPGLKLTEKRLGEILSIEKKNRQIELLLNRAEAALNIGLVYDPDKKGALSFYQKVLSMNPDNVTAKLGLLEIVDILIVRAQSALDSGDLKQAESKVSLVESISPDKSAIRELRFKINNASRLNEIMTRADTAFANNSYTTPKNNNAYDLYKQALAIAPANRHSKQQLDEIAAYYTDKSWGYTQLGNIASAQRNLEILEDFFPNDSNISSIKQEIRIKQAQINASKKAREKQLKFVELLPVGVNQSQGDYQVVQDIVGLFINAFESKHMGKLLRVSHLTSQQQTFYSRIFGLYQSLGLKVMPNSFVLNKKNGVAQVKFEISDLVNSKGQQVESAAYWSKIDIRLVKKDGQWLKAEIGQGIEGI